MAVQLDARAFKALSSPTRVTLLKKLGVKPRSLSSLAEEAGLSVQATDEHMHKLVQAGLVEKEKKAKWAYYRLSAAGRSLVTPDRQPVYLMLAVSLFLLLASAITWIQEPPMAPAAADYGALPELAQGRAMDTAAPASEKSLAVDATSASAPAFGTPSATPQPSGTVQAQAVPAPSETNADASVQTAALPWTWVFAMGSFLSLTVAIFWWRRQG